MTLNYDKLAEIQRENLMARQMAHIYNRSPFLAALSAQRRREARGIFTNIDQWGGTIVTENPKIDDFDVVLNYFKRKEHENADQR